MYGRKPILPASLQQDPVDLLEENVAMDAIFTGDEDIVLKNAKEMQKIQSEIWSKASMNINKAQMKQKKDYEQRQKKASAFKVGQEVLVRNLKRQDRKGGKQEYPWNGPYTINSILDKGLCTIKNDTGIVLKKKIMSEISSFITAGLMKLQLLIVDPLISMKIPFHYPMKQSPLIHLTNLYLCL